MIAKADVTANIFHHHCVRSFSLYRSISVRRGLHLGSGIELGVGLRVGLRNGLLNGLRILRLFDSVSRNVGDEKPPGNGSREQRTQHKLEAEFV